MAWKYMEENNIIKLRWSLLGKFRVLHFSSHKTCLQWDLNQKTPSLSLRKNITSPKNNKANYALNCANIFIQKTSAFKMIGRSYAYISINSKFLITLAAVYLFL